ncbi:hypothetical protein BDZ89DRAFT_1046435 [Hymenopellis radicata]|nr:hypothetical protein BDZ89DRAFT_1046435 [Hymenopellis radicata]
MSKRRPQLKRLLKFVLLSYVIVLWMLVRTSHINLFAQFFVAGEAALDIKLGAPSSRARGNNESVDDVARELHEKLLLRNESTKKVVIESIYKESPEQRRCVYDGAVPRRSSSAFEKGPWHAVHGQILADAESQQGQELLLFHTRHASTSTPRKVVTEFAAFGAPANVSVFWTAVASTPFSLAGGKAAEGISSSNVPYARSEIQKIIMIHMRENSSNNLSAKWRRR